MANNQSHARVANKAKVMLIEDHTILREWLKKVINYDEQFKVVGEAWDMQTTKQSLNKTIPDLAIVDISLPTESGIELIRYLTTSHEGITILVLTMHDERTWGERSIKAGARGYLNKKEGSDILLTAMRTVLSGQYYASDDLISLVFGRLSKRNSMTPIEQLSIRELEVLELMGLGKNSKQIGETLSISIRTIHTYQQRLKKKLGLANMNELLRYAFHRTDDLSKTINSA